MLKRRRKKKVLVKYIKIVKISVCIDRCIQHFVPNLTPFKRDKYNYQLQKSKKYYNFTSHFSVYNTINCKKGKKSILQKKDAFQCNFYKNIILMMVKITKKRVNESKLECSEIQKEIQVKMGLYVHPNSTSTKKMC